MDFAFEDGMGFERYVDYALDVPMYFIHRDGAYLDASGLSFRDFMARKLPLRPGEMPLKSDWDDHLTTLFPKFGSSHSSKCGVAMADRLITSLPCPLSGPGCSMTPIACRRRRT